MIKELNTVTNTKKSFDENTEFDFQDFLDVCPFDMDELRKKNRQIEICEWRQIGMTWFAIHSNYITGSAIEFERDHTTVCHAMKQIQNRKFSKTLNEKVNALLNYSENERK